MYLFVYLYISSLASPKVLGQLGKFHISLQNTLSTTNIKADTSNETKGKLSIAQPASPKGQEHHPQPTEAPFISGTTQVSEQSKGRHPVVVLMGYELGEKSSKKVNEVLTNADSVQETDPGADNNVGPQGLFTDRMLALRENSTSLVRPVLDHNSTARIPSEENVPESDLEEISELLDNAAASTSEGLRNNQYMHEESNESIPDTNALQLKMHAPSLDIEVMNALQSNVTHDRGIENPDTILPVSSDDTVNQQAIEQMTMHAQQDAEMVNSTSMANTALKLHKLEGMPSDLSGMVNKHGNINNPVVQVSAC